MTKSECARLQGLESLTQLPESDNAAYKALGNAINTKVASLVAESLLQRSNNYNNISEIKVA